MKKLVVVFVLAGVVLAAGCGSRDELEALSAELEKTQLEVEALAQAHNELQADIAELKVLRAGEATNAAPVSAEAAALIVRALASNINEVVTAQIDERIGTVEDIDAIMAESIQDELAAAEARTEEAQQARREQWRQEAEKRRQQWEQNRIDSVANDLELSEDQKSQVVAANEEMHKQMRETMQEIRSTGDWTKIGSAMGELRQANNGRMQEIMTEDQYNAYTNRQANQARGIMDMFSGFMSGVRPAGGGQ